MFVVLQLTVIPFFSFGTFRPDLLSVFVTIFALLSGRVQGMFAGFAIGLVFDLLSGGVIGLSSFAKTINGFAGGSFAVTDKKNNISKIKLLLVMVFCATLDNFFYSFISGSYVTVNVIQLLVYHGIIPGLYTAVIGSPVLLVIERLSNE